MHSWGAKSHDSGYWKRSRRTGGAIHVLGLENDPGPVRYHNNDDNVLPPASQRAGGKISLHVEERPPLCGPHEQVLDKIPPVGDARAPKRPEA